MPTIAYRAFRRKGVFDNPRAVIREIERTMDGPVKAHVLEEHRKRVANWESDVDFAARKFLRSNGIWVNVFATGEDKRVWNYVDKGTRQHWIFAVNAPKLVFTWGGPGSYTPKTDEGDVYGQDGGPSGELTWRNAVLHPGNQPRHFSKIIGRRYSPEFKREIRNAIRRGKRRARRF